MDIKAALQEMIQDENNKIAKAQAEIDAAEARVLELESAVKDYDKQLKAEYDKGVEYGKGLIILPDPQGDEPKLYSQAEVDQVVASVKEEVRVEKDKEIETLNAEHADEIKELNEEYSDYDDVKAERDQLVKAHGNDPEQVAQLKQDMEALLTKFEEDVKA